jgi:hypothetical protein
MSDTVSGRQGGEEDGAQIIYEAPILRPIGNVRDLLAGGDGSNADVFDPTGGLQPNQQNP